MSNWMKVVNYNCLVYKRKQTIFSRSQVEFNEKQKEWAYFLLKILYYNAGKLLQLPGKFEIKIDLFILSSLLSNISN